MEVLGRVQQPVEALGHRRAHTPLPNKDRGQCRLIGPHNGWQCGKGGHEGT